MIRAVLFGHGRMGTQVGLHAASHGVEVIGVLTHESTAEDWEQIARARADVVIDFATGEALQASLEAMCAIAPRPRAAARSHAREARQPSVASRSAHARSQRRHASAHTRQCSCICACCSHSSAHALHAVWHASRTARVMLAS